MSQYLLINKLLKQLLIPLMNVVSKDNRKYKSFIEKKIVQLILRFYISLVNKLFNCLPTHKQLLPYRFLITIIKNYEEIKHLYLIS